MVSDWRRLSVLIVGCGSIGKRHARVLSGLGVTDVRACDPVHSQRESLVAQVPSVRLYDSFKSGLAGKPEVVLIGTPPKLHVPMAIEAVRDGCHVFCEKPLSDSTEEIGDLVRTASAHNRKVMVGLCFRYHDGHRKAKRYLDEGCIGRLVSVRALMGEYLPEMRPDYRTLFSSQYSGAFDLMHEIDLAIWYAGRNVQRVLCLAGNYSDIGISAPDLVELILDFDDRRTASIHLDFFQRPRRRMTELIGTSGVITVEFARWDKCTVSLYRADAGKWEHEHLDTNRDDMFRAEDTEFLEAIVQDLPITCSIEEAVKSVEVVMIAQQNTRSHSGRA